MEISRTPVDLLNSVDLPPPAPILPWIYPIVDALFAVKDKIQNLELSPIKSDEDQAHYKTFSREALGIEVLEMLGTDKFLFMPNRFPYLLHPEIDQFILWIKTGISEEEIDEKLSDLLKIYGDAILFERSTVTNTPMSRGTIRNVRHIHFWCRKK